MEQEVKTRKPSDVLAERARTEERSCGECVACPHSQDAEQPGCGWIQGMLLAEHHPTRIGVVLEARVLDPLGVVWAMRETVQGWALLPEPVAIADALMKSGMPVLVGDIEGNVIRVVANEEQRAALEEELGVDLRAAGVDPRARV